jgi:hypothetical protein
MTDCAKTDCAKTDSAKTEGPDAESPRRLAAARGLGRAHARFPDTVAAAFAHGGRAMSTLPAPFPALTAPRSPSILPLSRRARAASACNGTIFPIRADAANIDRCL